MDTAVFDWPGATLAPATTGLGQSAALLAAETSRVSGSLVPEVPAALQGSPLRDQVAFAQDLEAADRARDWLEQQASSVSIEGSLADGGAAQGGRALFVTLGGALGVSRETFGAYSSVQFEGLLGAEREQTAERLRAYYRALDGLLRDLWSQMPEPRWMVVVSPYGLRQRSGTERFGSLVRPERDLSLIHI